MSVYCNHLIGENPSLLPICTYQDSAVLLIIGSREKQESSPVLRTYDHCLCKDPSKMIMEWPSLTNMMLAYAEGYEALSDGKLTETERKAIYQKYSNNSEWGFHKFFR
jgi:hypothetical protein